MKKYQNLTIYQPNNPNTQKSDTIKDFLKNGEYKEIENMFNIRKLNKQLESELDFSYNTKKTKYRCLGKPL